MSHGDDTLTPAEAERIRRLIREAAQVAHISEADELAILESLAVGDLPRAERIRHLALVRAMARELDALLRGASLTRH